jgi:hypothetical protein
MSAIVAMSHSSIFSVSLCLDCARVLTGTIRRASVVSVVVHMPCAFLFPTAVFAYKGIPVMAWYIDGFRNGIILRSLGVYRCGWYIDRRRYILRRGWYINRSRYILRSGWYIDSIWPVNRNGSLSGIDRPVRLVR